MIKFKSIKDIFQEIGNKIKAVSNKCKQVLLAGKDVIVLYMTSEPYTWENKKNNRRLIITLSSLFFLNYILFCYHADKNIFAIFPSVPPISSQHEITVHLPGLDGETIISEKRESDSFESDERFIQFLFNNVVKGSMFENTAIAVPVEMSIRKIWLIKDGSSAEDKNQCAIDCDITIIDPEMIPLPGSEPLFRKALAQTITANIPHISDVVLLENGIPGKNFW